MLSQSEKTFFDIWCSIIWGTTVELPTDINWQNVLNLAARQKCLHAFVIWLKSHHIHTPFDKHLLPKMVMTMQHQARLNHFTIDIINLLEQNDIPATLIKGYSLSCIYPDPDTRDFGDVDIYVGEQHYKDAAKIITEAYPDAYWHSDIRGGIHYILVLDELLDRVVELHRVTMEFSNPKANQLFQNFTLQHLNSHNNTIEIFGESIPVPSAAYNALYVFMHAWHHFESTGVGFRQLGDWALCLKLAHQQSTPKEWQMLTQEIEQILTALHMKTAWQTFGHVLVSQLKLPVETFPLYTARYEHRANRLLHQLLRDGHGGRPAMGQKGGKAEIALMKRFPWERPKKYRILQKAYTASRLLFDTWQMSKFFPSFAWHELKATIRSKYETDCTHKLHNNIALHVEHKGR